MKVLLINVCLRPYRTEFIYFPIGLAYIATAIERAGFDFEILDLDAKRMSDDELEQYLRNHDFDVAALGCIVTGYKYVKHIAGLIKKHKDVPVIAGNSVVTSIPQILLTKTEVDIGVMGEGDNTIVELLKAIENKTTLEEVKGIALKKEGKLVFTPERELIPSLDSLPFINYELLDMKTYLAKFKYIVSEPYPLPFEQLVAFPVNTARGCPYSCTFCYHVFRHKRFRVRSPQNIVREIQYLQKKYGVNYVNFADELSLYSKTQASKFADCFIDAGVKVFWGANCRAGLFTESDLDLALKLKGAGCISLGYSLESADQDILKAMHKKITVKDFAVQTDLLHRAGINPVTSLVIGYPQETEETLKKTFDCCYDCNIYPSAGYLLPQPGTEMYDYAVEIGKIADEEEYLMNMGDRQDFRINLTGIQQERIEELVKDHLKRIADKMQLGLDEDHLIKTGHYRQQDTSKTTEECQ